MPYTINGIGTWYYGKKNVVQESGVCPHCGKPATLTSYETRLWFTILYIPIIPLQRRQISEECGICRQHRWMPLQKWLEASGKAVAVGIAEARQKPDDPQSAMNLHRMLFETGKGQEAVALAGLMEQKFNRNADVLIYLASSCDRTGRVAEGSRLYDLAYQADPANPLARRAAGVGFIEKGDLARAAELLKICAEPGPHQASAPLLLLAQAHAKKGEHAEAMKIYESLAATFPDLKQDKAMRKAVRQSERALKRPTMLPPNRARRRAAMIGFGAAVLLIGLAFGLDLYKRRHHRLFVVNGFDERCQVSLNGGTAWSVWPGGYVEHRVPEGLHTAEVTCGAFTARTPLPIRTTFFARWFRRPISVLNPAGAAVMGRQEIYYGQAATGSGVEHQLFVNTQAITLEKIDYAFVDPPQSVKTEHGHATKQLLFMAPLPPESMPSWLLTEKIPPGEVIKFVETHLRVKTRSTDLLGQYAGLCAQEHDIARCIGFLRSGLDWQPISVEWHKLYQALCESLDDVDLVAEYDARLKAKPDDANLLYLRGRLADADEALEYGRRAIAADPANAYGYWMLAYDFMDAGNFAEARPLFAKIAELGAEIQGFDEAFFRTRFALGEYDALTEELRKSPVNSGEAQLRLMQVYAAAGKNDLLQQRIDEIIGATGDSPETAEGYRVLAAFGHYFKRDFDACLAMARQLPEGESRQYLEAVVAVEKGDYKTAADLIEKEDVPVLRMCLWLAARRQNRPEEAAAHLELIKMIYSASPWKDFRKFGKMLDGTATDPVGEMKRYNDQTGKAAYCMVLAELYPAQREELLKLAEALDVTLTPPHWFLVRMRQEMRK